MLNILEIFFTNTTIHGLTYIAQASRHKIEKIFWFLSLTISFILTGFLIRKLVIESQINPTVIYTAKNTVNIKDVTFPAVTVCLGLKYKSSCRTIIDYDLIKKQLEKNKTQIVNLTLDELKLMQVLSLASRDHFMSENFPSLKIPTDDFMDQLEIFQEMVPHIFRYNTATSYLMSSLWLNKYVLDTVKVLTDSGYCYTFNMPQLEDIYKPESIFYNFSVNRVIRLGQMGLFEIFDGEFINSSYPQKARGRDEGLSLELDMSPSQCLLPNGTRKALHFVSGAILDPITQGYYIKVHSPYEVVSKKDIRFGLDMNEHNELAAIPKITKIDKSLIGASINERNCYLKNERELMFFKVYNKVNCEHECLTQMTLKSCGCVQFFMARNEVTKVCGTSDEKCFLEVEDQFDMIKSACKCYDPCESVKYEVELRNKGKYYAKETVQRLSKMTAKVTPVVDSVFVLSKKKSQTAVEFLSFIGGLLGLFAGFSVMTVAELFYYFIAYPLIQRLKSNDTKVYPFIEDNKSNTEELKQFKISRFLKEALEGSSIHTFSYIGSDWKSLTERFAWLILFTFSMIVALYAVRDVYVTYKDSSITIKFEGSPTSVEDIPFPAFTLIHDLELNVFDKFDDNITSFFYNYSYYYEVYNQFQYVACTKFAYLRYIPKIEFKSNKDFMEVMDYYTFYQHPWFETRNATWNKFVDPPFAMILTSTLKGYTFNLIEQSKLLNEDLISDDFYYTYGNKNNPGFPWSASAREDMGLNLEVNLSIVHAIYRHDSCQLRDSMIIHPPNELPIGFEQITVTVSSNHVILITPRIIKSDEGLKSLDINIRKCYFDGERKLKFFKIYTQRNCELECHAHIFSNTCGCTPYNQIRNKTANICDFFRSKKCHTYFQNYINYSAYDNLYATDGVCNCLPTCNYIEYSYEINRIGELHHWYVYDKSTGFEMRWKDSEYFAMYRSQQIRLVDFLAYVGGILGLFAGISVLSIFEVIYFLTLRLAIDFFGYNRH